MFYKLLGALALYTGFIAMGEDLKLSRVSQNDVPRPGLESRKIAIDTFLNNSEVAAKLQAIKNQWGIGQKASPNTLSPLELIHVRSSDIDGQTREDDFLAIESFESTFPKGRKVFNSKWILGAYIRVLDQKEAKVLRLFEDSAVDALTNQIQGYLDLTKDPIVAVVIPSFSRFLPWIQMNEELETQGYTLRKKDYHIGSTAKEEDGKTTTTILQLSHYEPKESFQGPITVVVAAFVGTENGKPIMNSIRVKGLYRIEANIPK